MHDKGISFLEKNYFFLHKMTQRPVGTKVLSAIEFKG